ncbi:MAG: hypothetical protein J7539_12725 [Niabella sp.]|nr:hypothetical protein [Niabella sp.]
MKNLFTIPETKPLGKDSIMALAFHEAGHAVIHFAFGIPFLQASIIKNEIQRSLGRVTRFIEPTNPDFVEDWLMEHNPALFDKWTFEVNNSYWYCGCMSGVIAQKMYTGAEDWEGAGHDMEVMLEHQPDGSLDETLPLNEALQPYADKTFKLLTANLSLLKKVAADLYESKELGKSYFDAIAQSEAVTSFFSLP